MAVMARLPGARIAVMARAPVPGRAKTRLAPALGADAAAALAARMLDHAVAQAVAAGVGPVTVWATPDAGHPAFVAAQRRHGVALAVQAGDDLGERMAHVFQDAFGSAAAAGRAGAGEAPGTLLPLLLIGTDAPALDAARLRQAAAALESVPVVFVPALDGGYALVGLRPPPARRLPDLLAALFDGLPWSTPRVMADTRRRLAAGGWRHAELTPVADIDDADDLRHLPAGWLDARADR